MCTAWLSSLNLSGDLVGLRKDAKGTFLRCLLFLNLVFVALGVFLWLLLLFLRMFLYLFLPLLVVLVVVVVV